MPRQDFEMHSDWFYKKLSRGKLRRIRTVSKFDIVRK